MFNKSNESSDVMSNEVSQDVLEADISISLLAAKQKGEFLAQCHKVLDDNRHDESRFKSILIKLHNTGKIDLVHEFGLLKKTDFGEYDFFSVRNLFEAILPELQAPVLDVCLCAKQLIEESRPDMAAGWFWNGVEEFLLKSRNRVDEAFEFSFAREENADILSVVCRVALRIDFRCFFERIVSLVKDVSIPAETRRGLLHSLASIPAEKQGKDVLIELISILEDYTTKKLVGFDNELFRLVVHVSSLWQNKGQVCGLLEEILQRHDSSTLYSAALHFATTPEMPLQEKEIFLRAFLFVPPEDVGTIARIDSGLCRTLKEGEWKGYVDFIANLIVKTEGRVKATQFDSFLRNHIGVAEESRNYLVTKWFLSQEINLFHAVGDFTSILYPKDPYIVVDRELVGDNQLYLYFLARKALGWFSLRPRICVSFVLSCVNLMDEDTLNEIRSVFVNPLALNCFPELNGYFTEYKQSFSSRSAQYVELVLEEVGKYYAKLRELPDLLEFRVPTEHFQLHRKREGQLFQKSMKEAQKGTLVDQITTKVMLIHGSSTVFYRSLGGVLTRVPGEEMKRFSSEFRIPNSLFVDPLNYDYTLRCCRVERLTNETNY